MSKKACKHWYVRKPDRPLPPLRYPAKIEKQGKGAKYQYDIERMAAPLGPIHWECLKCGKRLPKSLSKSELKAELRASEHRMGKRLKFIADHCEKYVKANG